MSLAEYLREGAKEDYQKAYNEATKQLGILKSKIDRHKARQKQDPRNYGYVGDMAHIKAILSELNQSINV